MSKMPNSSTGPTDDGRDGFTGTWIPPELRQSLPRKPVLAFDRAVAKQQQKQEPQKDPEPEWKCPSSDCRLSFNTEAELTRHQKVKSHWGCLVCKIDYKDQMALSNHIQQAHRQDQDLQCPGCEVQFPIASQFINHIETHRCPRIFPSTLHEHRKKQSASYRTLHDIDLVESVTRLDLGRGQPSYQVYEEDSLTSERSYTQQYPELGKELQDYRNGYSNVPDLLTGEPRKKLIIPPAVLVENRWEKGKGQGQELFPDAAPAVRPEPQGLRNLTAAAPSTRDIDPNEKITDPDDARFNAAVFYHPIMEKYTCAHFPKCKAKFQTHKALISHLRSSAHKANIEFTCPRCLRKYNSMTAAMAHVEAATRVCKIRETEDFRKFVIHVTGGLLDGLNSSEDRLSDGTPRYVIHKAFVDSLQLPALWSSKKQ
ncbi:hypothetical protein G7054_g12556 [Neopestalotiopsis clavispora]|nr:hypothetical protein G7054_g12556 [Neopestalotiopsis clavispora]